MPVQTTPSNDLVAIGGNNREFLRAYFSDRLATSWNLASPSAMAHFFLISGSEGRQSDWQSCTSRLRAEGHEVTAFGWEDLPWYGGIEGVVESLRERVRGMDAPVLVGHSAGGLLVPRISQGVKVSGEVYLAALTPQPGLSFAEQMFESPVDVFDAEWLASAYRAGSSEAAILRKLYEAPFSEYAAGSRLYLTCLADKEIRPEWQRWVAREVLHAEVQSLEAGHYAHVTMAGEVCAAVTAFAQAGWQRD
ncbi:alpha/beta fold hydrolase [Verrucomicrobiota bacterium sgz303538]